MQGAGARTLFLFGDPSIVFFFVLMVDSGAVFQLDFQRGGIIQVDGEIDLIFGNNFPSLFQCQSQSGRSVSPTAIILVDTVANVPGAVAQRIVEVVAQVKDAHIIFFVVYQDEYRVRHKAIGQILTTVVTLSYLRVG